MFLRLPENIKTEAGHECFDIGHTNKSKLRNRDRPGTTLHLERVAAELEVRLNVASLLEVATSSTSAFRFRWQCDLLRLKQRSIEIHKMWTQCGLSDAGQSPNKRDFAYDHITYYRRR